MRAPGASLDPGTARAFGAKFGHDFSRVRVHTDETAAASAEAVGASAYAAGRHVVFGAGIAPASYAAKHIVAHELAHVAQQGGMSDTVPTRMAPVDAPAEREAQQLMSAPGPAQAHAAPATLHAYRPTTAPNFRGFDPPGFTEEEYAKGKPWIDQINIDFTSTAKDSVTGATLPTGTMKATYDGGSLS